MKRLLSALSLVALVAALSASSAPDRHRGTPRHHAPATSPADGAAPGAPRPNNAYRLVETPDMPGWAKRLYRDDVTPNVRELDREFEQWAAMASWEKHEMDGESSSEENPWEEYYRRWRSAVEPFVQLDGSIDFERGAAPQSLSEAGRTTPLATVSTTWGPVGPISTVVQSNPNATPPQPLASLQANIYCFDVAASNPSILYCGSETGAVSKTVDKGLHWTPVGVLYAKFRSPIGAIAIHPTDPNTVYVGNGAGVNRSTDGGATWSLDLSDAGLTPNDIKIKPGAPNELLAGGSRLMRRTAALTWTEVLPRTTYDLEFEPGDAATAYALVKHPIEDRCEFLKSTDGGQTFTVRSAGWLTGLNDSGGRLTVTPASPGRIYAVVLTSDGPRILRSNDSGENWSVVASNPVGSGRVECSVVPSPLAMTNGQGYYDVSIAASATNPDHLIVGTLWSYRSVDGGASYSIMEHCTDFPVHADVQEMKNVGGDSWIATDGGMNLSTDFWATPANFSSRTNGLRGSQCWGFGQGWNEDALTSGRYHNASGAWHEGFPPGRFLAFGTGEPITGYVNPANSRMIYDFYAGGVILPASITEPLATFPVTKFPTETRSRGGPFPSMDNGEQEWDPRYASTYYIGRLDGLWRTRDNGTTFTLLWTRPGDPLAEVQHIEISRTNPDVIYVTVWRPTAGELWKSTNGGASFTQCANPGDPTALQRQVSTIALSGTDANVIWWCFRSGPDGNKIFKSTDGGQSWSNLTTAALNGVTLADMAHQLGTNGGVYLNGDFGAVFYRNNAMPDWVTYNAGLPAQLNTEMSRIAIQYKYRKLRMASVSGFWQVNLYENSTTTLPQPMVDRSNPCPEDTLQFESYSVVNGPASYDWSFSPPVQWISNANARNPRVVLGWAAGPYAATLTVTDDNGVTQRTISNMVNNLPAPQWAAGVVDFSSQYTSADWSASAAIGPPDVYPLYGDNGNAWASTTEDDQAEFIHLSFATPTRASFVEVVETYNPGALVRVSVKNPNTNQLQVVWAGRAAAADPVSRILTIPFAEPPFLVGEVRLDFDSPAVTGWNEVDAVGIGLSGCVSTAVSAAPPTVSPPALTALRQVAPNPFTRTVRIVFNLSLAGDVKIDVFNVLGQRVKRLLDQALPAAEHEIAWDGRDQGGRFVAGGIYYLRLEAGGVHETRKLIKVQ